MLDTILFRPVSRVVLPCPSFSPQHLSAQVQNGDSLDLKGGSKTASVLRPFESHQITQYKLFLIWVFSLCLPGDLIKCQKYSFSKFFLLCYFGSRSNNYFVLFHFLFNNSIVLNFSSWRKFRKRKPFSRSQKIWNWVFKDSQKASWLPEIIADTFSVKLIAVH